VTDASLDQYLPAIKLALKTGLQVESAVNILEMHVSTNMVKRALLRENLPQILCLMEDYLLSASDDKLKRTIVYKTDSVLKAQSKYQDSTMNHSEDTIQRIILRFLGRLGGDNQDMIIPASSAIQTSLAWSTINCAIIKFPLPDVQNDRSSGSSSSSSSSLSKTKKSSLRQIKLPLDKLLPRIVDLCNAQGSDRQLRTAAAEALHAITIFMIGSAASLPDRGMDQSESIFAPIYLHIFPTILNLSVDSDNVCRQLFDKLLFQIVHWFSGQNQVHSHETSTLVECLINGLCSSGDGAIREQSAKGLSEYFKWIIKQSTKKELIVNASKAEEILKKLLVLASHPAEMGPAITKLP
jgi:hypothetical protein